MPDSDKIVVEILGTRLQLRGGDDPETVRRVAEYVKERVEELAAHAPTAPSLQLALLTAINIADELYHVTQEGNDEHELLEAALEKANRILVKAGGAKG